MKLLLLPLLMAFLAVAQVFCEEIGPKEELDYWTSSSQMQVPYRFMCSPSVSYLQMSFKSL